MLLLFLVGKFFCSSFFATDWLLPRTAVCVLELAKRNYALATVNYGLVLCSKPARSKFFPCALLLRLGSFSRFLATVVGIGGAVAGSS